MDNATRIPFDNSYARLPEQCYSRLDPTPVAAPSGIRVNRELAELLGIDPHWLESKEGCEVIAGNRIPAGAEPLAAVYAGHQFGSFNPQLGDGRAILLGEVLGSDGQRYDIQLKGSGPTPYSRGGDGRSPLGPVLREYVLCEAMHKLGVPTSRALAAVNTGEQVRREQFLPGAVLARVASSHIRVGTLQFFASRGDTASLQAVVEHCIQRHYRAAAQDDNPPLALLQGVMQRQAELVASWQLLGFIHGVMNTDNTLLSGETIDYGPCAFMDEFDPDKCFSSIDQNGRYRFRNQPGIAHWNLAQLAQALLPLLHDDREQAVEIAQEAINVFPGLFERVHSEGLQRKLGLSGDAAETTELVEELFGIMASDKADFTLTFRQLTAHAGSLSGQAEAPTEPSPLELAPSLTPWLNRWQRRFESDPGDPLQRLKGMQAANPLYIPRNHLVEEAIEAATANDDFAPFNQLVDVLTGKTAGSEHYALPPRPEEQVAATFCGT